MAIIEKHNIINSEGISVDIELIDDRGLANAIADVLAFHRKLCPQIVRPLPAVPADRDKTDYCFGFIQEEVEELQIAMRMGDLPNVADGLVDLIYVAIRAAFIWGIDLREVWNEVHRANMRKEGGHTRPDGKVMKPENWIPPDVKGVLQNQRPITP